MELCSSAVRKLVIIVIYMFLHVSISDRWTHKAQVVNRNQNHVFLWSNPVFCAAEFAWMRPNTGVTWHDLWLSIPGVAMSTRWWLYCQFLCTCRCVLMMVLCAFFSPCLGISWPDRVVCTIIERLPWKSVNISVSDGMSFLVFCFAMIEIWNRFYLPWVTAKGIFFSYLSIGFPVCNMQ